MDVKISPGALRGRVEIPPSKSAAHRALVCALLAEGVSTLTPFPQLRDIRATEGGIQALGAKANRSGAAMLVQGGRPLPDRVEIDCGDCGATLRFLLPVAAALGARARFLGRGRLPNRPLTDLTDELARHGARFRPGTGGVITEVEGRLRPGVYHLPGDVSSQYISGLLFALPLLEGESELRLTTPLQSRSYVDITIDALAAFDVAVEPMPGGYRVPAPQVYQPSHYTLEGDYSSAAFWLCANALGSQVGVTGLSRRSKQGDRVVGDLLLQIAAVRGRQGFVELDISQTPDLLPVLAAVAAFSSAEVCFQNAARLRTKESDRLRAMTAGLTAIGGAVREYSDMLVVTGRRTLPGGAKVGTFGDHRIAMAIAVAALRCENPVTIVGAECVEKSYPGFFDDFRMLGGDCVVL